ncbi:flap structure-specific endonuclease, partial [Nanoarchaeota archaeon]
KEGIKPIFVFDGVRPELKHQEVQKRLAVKKEAEKLYQEALSKEDIEGMKKYASRTTKLTNEMIDDSKELLTLLGIPIIQAPSEGEAQAAYLTQTGEAYAVASQDYDSLLYNTTYLIQNLSIAGRRKKHRSLGTVVVKPTIIDLKRNLDNLEITREQLIALAMLIGTDYNPGGIKGIGPKNALKLVKKHGIDFDALFEEVKWKEHFEFSWKEVFVLFTELPVKKGYTIKFGKIMKEELIKFLVKDRDFRLERVEKTINDLEKKKEELSQKSLDGFL